MIEIYNIEKYFNNIKVLDIPNLKIRTGEIE
jgi:ABC-type sugar transport system ATPase subunit